MSWENRLSLQQGATVRMSRELAESLSSPDAHQARGKVLGVEDRGDRKIARVQWDEPDLPDEVNILHLKAVKERGR